MKLYLIMELMRSNNMCKLLYINMLRYLIPVILVIIIVLNVNAQDQQARDKIESARIALITERLGLTPEQAEKFWPVYREYSEKRRELARELQQARQGVDPQNMTEEQSRELVNLAMEMKQRQLDLEKEYSNKLMNVISSQQMLSLRKAEDDFRRMLLQKLQERRQQAERRQQFQQQREEMMRRNRPGNN